MTTLHPARIAISYATKSQFKQEEIAILAKVGKLADGTQIEDLFEFQIRKVPIVESLEVDLTRLVAAEVTEAYRVLKVPCIVEHAGLIFEEYKDEHYPGGLTKAMWNALGDRFVTETQSRGRRAVARAVVAYCDGTRIETFVGETAGEIAESPRGDRKFYWDTVFVPDGGGGSTFAEIVADPARGIEHKVTILSQSTKAILKFLEFRRHNQPSLWPRLP